MAGFARYAALLVLVAGCASMPGSEPSHSKSWAYFTESPTDLWSEKIADWQGRQVRDGGPLPAATEGTPWIPPNHALLQDKVSAFQRRERRALARRITELSQREARRHYKWDPETDLANDPWPTSPELYAQNGDDCDGLDLIAYDLLRAFGYPEGEIYRAVIRRNSDGANHMATLWFENPEDPWVLDATGAITRGMSRFSELPGWTPLRVFDEDDVFGVAPGAGSGAGKRSGSQGVAAGSLSREAAQ